MHEAREMVARQDSKKMTLLPVKLYDAPLNGPTWLNETPVFPLLPRRTSRMQLTTPRPWWRPS